MKQAALGMLGIVYAWLLVLTLTFSRLMNFDGHARSHWQLTFDGLIIFVLMAGGVNLILTAKGKHRL